MRSTTVSRCLSDPSSCASFLSPPVNRLRRENASLKLDNDLLKKAAAYFARESR